MYASIHLLGRQHSIAAGLGCCFPFWLGSFRGLTAPPDGVLAHACCMVLKDDGADVVCADYDAAVLLVRGACEIHPVVHGYGYGVALLDGRPVVLGVEVGVRGVFVDGSVHIAVERIFESCGRLLLLLC